MHFTRSFFQASGDPFPVEYLRTKMTATNFAYLEGVGLVPRLVPVGLYRPVALF